SDNISFFDPQPDMPWLLQCAQMAAIHDDIQAMPMGYNTLVGDLAGGAEHVRLVGGGAGNQAEQAAQQAGEGTHQACSRAAAA
ncbi:hypothetical protein, partial [Pseudomonas aeruginosa]|uniref:hypothetical protein n=1 Tax=Pseudomonas aeruginosa TaxID=287 RepID=UPI00163AFA65